MDIVFSSHAVLVQTIVNTATLNSPAMTRPNCDSLDSGEQKSGRSLSPKAKLNNINDINDATSSKRALHA